MGCTRNGNRLKHTNGPLFRGRYKAILVETDRYLLLLSRNIHRNPIEMPRPLVPALEHILGLAIRIRCQEPNY